MQGGFSKEEDNLYKQYRNNMLNMDHGKQRENNLNLNKKEPETSVHESTLIMR